MSAHEWEPSPYGHGSARCKNCLATLEEITAVGDIDQCRAEEMRRSEAEASAKIRQAFRKAKP